MHESKEEEQDVALKAAQALTKLEDALWWQLRVILKKPFNAKTLKELERTARLAREMLIVAKGEKTMDEICVCGHPKEDHFAGTEVCNKDGCDCQRFEEAGLQKG